MSKSNTAEEERTAVISVNPYHQFRQDVSTSQKNESKADDIVLEDGTTMSAMEAKDRLRVIDQRIGQIEALLEEARRPQPFKEEEDEYNIDLTAPDDQVSDTADTDHIVEAICADNMARVARVHAKYKPLPTPITSYSQYPFYEQNVHAAQFHEPRLVFCVARQKQKQREKEQALLAEYKRRWRLWTDNIAQVDHAREARYRMFDDRELMNEPPVFEIPTAQRGNRRNLHNLDAARSEAEFEDILRSLQSATELNPEVRARKTAATIPSMILDPKVKRATYENYNGLIVDPIRYFIRDKYDGHWTQEERAVFLRKYALYPKQFGRIASHLPHKTTKQCIAFYYHEKRKMGLKNIVYKRDARRRKAATMSDRRRNPARSSALLSNVRRPPSRKQKEVRVEPIQEFVEKEQQEQEPVKEVVVPWEDPRTPVEASVNEEEEEDDMAAINNHNESEDEYAQPLPPAPPSTILTAKWSDTDRALALQAYQTHGRDFKTVANIVGTKTEEQCRNFYHNFKRKHGIPAMKGLSVYLANRVRESAENPDAAVKDGVYRRRGKRAKEELEAMFPKNKPAEGDAEGMEQEEPEDGREDLTHEEEEDLLAEPLKESVPEPLPEAVEEEGEEGEGESEEYNEDFDEEQRTAAEQAVEQMADIIMKRYAISEPDESKADDDADTSAKLGDDVTADGQHKRRPAFSSYWSKNERTSFPNYLLAFGRDFAQIATALGTKTDKQVRNYFHNNSEKLGFEEILRIREVRRQSSQRALQPYTEDVGDEWPLPTGGKSGINALLNSDDNPVHTPWFSETVKEKPMTITEKADDPNV
jgi:hypothetical protein